MASLQEIMARNQALKAAQEAEAVEGKMTGTGEPSPAIAAVASNIQTGLQSSIESAGFLASAPSMPTGELDPEKQAGSLAAFEDRGLRQFFLHNGMRIKADNGYFYAKSEEEVETLQDYATKGKVIAVSNSTEN